MIGALSHSTAVAVRVRDHFVSGLGLTTAKLLGTDTNATARAALGGIAGAQNMASNLSGVARPLLTGWLKVGDRRTSAAGYVWPMQLIWVFLLAGVGAYLFLVKEPKSADRRA
jgi:hypothetical protein